MSLYIVEAVRVLNNPEQTLCAKQVASDVLRNAGLSERDILRIKEATDSDPTERYYVFCA